MSISKQPKDFKEFLREFNIDCPEWLRTQNIRHSDPIVRDPIGVSLFFFRHPENYKGIRIYFEDHDRQTIANKAREAIECLAAAYNQLSS